MRLLSPRGWRLLVSARAPSAVSSSCSQSTAATAAVVRQLAQDPVTGIQQLQLETMQQPDPAQGGSYFYD